MKSGKSSKGRKSSKKGGGGEKSEGGAGRESGASPYPCLSVSKSGRLLLQVSVIPNASCSEVTRVTPSEVNVRLNAPPVEGEANKELVKFLSKSLQLKKSQLDLVQGHKSRLKTLEVAADAQLDLDSLFARLSLLLRDE